MMGKQVALRHCGTDPHLIPMADIHEYHNIWESQYDFAAQHLADRPRITITTEYNKLEVVAGVCTIPAANHFRVLMYDYIMRDAYDEPEEWSQLGIYQGMPIKGYAVLCPFREYVLNTTYEELWCAPCTYWIEHNGKCTVDLGPK